MKAKLHYGNQQIVENSASGTEQPEPKIEGTLDCESEKEASDKIGELKKEGYNYFHIEPIAEEKIERPGNAQPQER